MNPWVILAAVLAVGIAGATGYWQGGKHMRDSIEAQDARDAKLMAEVERRAQVGAAEAIAANKPIHQTIHKQLEKEVIRDPVFTTCKLPPDAFRLLDQALRSGGSPPEPAGDRELPPEIPGPPG